MNVRVWISVLGIMLTTLACSFLQNAGTSTPAASQTQSFTPEKSVPTLPPSPSSMPVSPALATPPVQGNKERSTAPYFAVIGVGEGDMLNVRSGPGVGNEIIDTLPPNAAGIALASGHQIMGEATWVSIGLPSGGTGWVNAQYLAEEVSKEKFCSDPRVIELSEKFVKAVEALDGVALSDLVSPVHGLTIRHEWWNPEVSFRHSEEVSDLFTTSTAYDWGIQDGSGFPIQGPFKEVVLPELLDVFTADYSTHCNTLEIGVATGGTAGIVGWPFEYAKVNFLALYRAAAPGDELNWRTWVVGVVYVRGEPHVAFLVGYHWEI